MAKSVGIRLIFLFCSVLGVGGVLYLLTVCNRPGPDPVDLLPADTVAVFDVTNPAGLIQRFQESHLGEQLTALNWPMLMSLLGVPKARIKEVLYKKKSMLFFSKEHFFAQLFRNRMVLALLPQEPNKTDNTSFAGLEELVLLVHTRTSSAEDTLARFAIEYEESIQEVYQGHTVITWKMSERRSLSVTSFKQLLLVSLSRKTLQRCLDQTFAPSLQQKKGLTGMRRYADSKKRARNKDDFFAYIDWQAILPTLEVLRRDNIPELKAIMKNTVPWSDLVETVIFFHQKKADVDRFSLIFDLDESSPTIVHTPAFHPRISKIPAGVLLHAWTNWLNTSSLWQRLVESGFIGESKIVGRTNAWLQKKTQRSLREILSYIGHEGSFTIQEIKTSGFVPVPRIFFRLTVNDPDSVQGILTQVLANVPVSTTYINRVPVVSIRAAGGHLQPSYALQGNSLIIADGLDLIRNVLHPSGKILTDDREMKQVDVGLTKTNNLTLFMRVAQLTEGLKEAVTIMAPIFVEMGWQQNGTDLREILNGVILPFLDSVKTFNVNTIRSYRTKDEVVIESAVMMY